MLKQPWQRAIVYIVGSLVLLLLVLFLFWYSYTTARQKSYIYIVANDGMNSRATAILKSSEESSEDETTLYQYFMPEFLQADSLLLQEPYANFEVNNYDYAVEIDSISVGPFSTRARCDVTELVSNIEGKAIDVPEGTSVSVPQWIPHRYRLRLVKTAENRWYISEIEELESTASTAPADSNVALAAAQ